MLGDNAAAFARAISRPRSRLRPPDRPFGRPWIWGRLLGPLPAPHRHGGQTHAALLPSAVLV